MTPGARKVLQELADNCCDLVREGIQAYCGQRRTTSRVVSELVGCSAVRPLIPGQERGAVYYTISNMGRAYLRRPELEEEYRSAVMLRKGPFTIMNDRIVLLHTPPREPQ